jgi:hypothetical protein
MLTIVARGIEPGLKISYLEPIAKRFLLPRRFDDLE